MSAPLSVKLPPAPAGSGALPRQTTVKSILFVDDEPNMLDGLRRMLSRFRGEWRMDFASGGEEALGLLAARSFDVMVTDMRMPGMNGAQLLARVAQQHPRVVRIVLSGLDDRELVPLSAFSAHQFLKKPCDAAALKAAIDRAMTLHTLLTASNLGAFITQVKSLPSAPSMYLELVEATRNPEVEVTVLSRILRKDVAMTTKVLQLINSPLLGFSRRILDPEEACIYLGADTIKSLVCSAAIFCQFHSAGLSHFSVDKLQSHSLRTSAVAKAIAQSQGLRKPAVEEALLAGLLHDVGKLVLASNDPQQYDRCVGGARETGEPLVSAEARCFGITHAEAGMYLLRLWGLPDAVTEAAALHHRPREGAESGFSALTSVYIADALVHENDGDQLDLDYLTELGVESCVPEWRRLCSQVDGS